MSSGARPQPAPADPAAGFEDRLPGRDADLDAATWYAANGFPLQAARAHRRAGDLEGTAALLEDAGDAILGGGGAVAVVDLVDAMPPRLVSPRLHLLRADALRMAGRVVEAARAFAPLIDAAERDGRWEAGLAWRAAMVHYMRGDFRGALELLDRPVAGTWPPTVDGVQYGACRASALMQAGRAEAAAALAGRTLADAYVLGDDRALAAAHIAVALCSAGTELDGHLARALEAAGRAGDVVQQARVLNNQADRLLREADYPRALAVAEHAVRTAERGAPPGLRANSAYNAGEALIWLGRYDEAIQRFEDSLRICHEAGLRRTAMPLRGLAEAHALRGQREQSRAAYEEAIEAARATDEPRLLACVLVGLARLLLDGGDPAIGPARAAADEARRSAPAMYVAPAITAQGWVALAAGDLAGARERGGEAVTAARAARQADALADALELTAAAGADPATARDALLEARHIWERAGARPAADRTLVQLGRLAGAGAEARAAGRSAAARLRALGVRQDLPGASAVPLEIRVLGRFDVLTGGRSVPLRAWRSRQARTLVKVLVARRGRPVARVELCELLWPDDRPDRTAHRLSVLLSVVRAVLDPDKRRPVDHHIRADAAGISLDTAHVRVDVEDLLSDAADGLALLRAGDVGRARDVLAEVDAGYRGDAFDDEPYADWATGIREEARAAWLRALRELAELQRDAGEPDQAAASLARLLSADEFDERAHRALVETLRHAGRHGEARRAFLRWTAAMRAIDAPLPEPVP